MFLMRHSVTVTLKGFQLILKSNIEVKDNFFLFLENIYKMGLKVTKFDIAGLSEIELRVKHAQSNF